MSILAVCGPQVSVNALGKLGAVQIAYLAVAVLTSGFAIGSTLEGKLRGVQLAGFVAVVLVIGAAVFAL
jgi:hypothetical protein